MRRRCRKPPGGVSVTRRTIGSVPRAECRDLPGATAGGALHSPRDVRAGAHDPGLLEGSSPAPLVQEPAAEVRGRDRDVLPRRRPRSTDLVVELGSARGDVTFPPRPLRPRGRRRDAAPGRSRGRAARAELEIANVVARSRRGVLARPCGQERRRGAAVTSSSVDDPTLVAMLRECRRGHSRPGGRLGIYTPDRAHYVERMAEGTRLPPEAVPGTSRSPRRRLPELLLAAGFAIDLETWSVSPFPGVRWVQADPRPLPLVGPPSATGSSSGPLRS
jgi:hypothetical protein